MISLVEARTLPRADFHDGEKEMQATVLRLLDAAIKEHFDGVGTSLVVPGDQANSRVMLAVLDKARQRGWHASLGLQIQQTPSLIAGGKPQFKFISFTVTVAVSSDAAEILRVRRETAG